VNGKSGNVSNRFCHKPIRETRFSDWTRGTRPLWTLCGGATTIKDRVGFNLFEPKGLTRHPTKGTIMAQQGRSFMATPAPIRPHETERTGPFTPEEAWILFQNTALLYMGMSGEQFLEKWDTGGFDDVDSSPQVMRVASLIPLVRKTSAGQKSF